MDLETYLFKTRQTFAAFARKLGCNAAYISRIARGIIKPSNKLARLIELETAGAVKMMGEEE